MYVCMYVPYVTYLPIYYTFDRYTSPFNLLLKRTPNPPPTYMYVCMLYMAPITALSTSFFPSFFPSFFLPRTKRYYPSIHPSVSENTKQKSHPHRFPEKTNHSIKMMKT
ncbi:hypothetical protein DM02DRAFT_159647 [Periconia macrospinosa]|uniref:Uncharacterized protein n=1 Tax=Periconia macrospinosa TaxID=97972 RepID=A0A2V1E603_9PLEO|nr:hypothetical protein DM02DRAFT_159647 [Periconia macrospinosa]